MTPAESQRLQQLQAWSAEGIEAVRAEGERICANIRAANYRHVDEFRASLPADRRGWFDGLTPAEQFRVSLPRLLAPRSDIQRDYDEERRDGWVCD